MEKIRKKSSRRSRVSVPIEKKSSYLVDRFMNEIDNIEVRSSNEPRKQFRHHNLQNQNHINKQYNYHNSQNHNNKFNNRASNNTNGHRSQFTQPDQNNTQPATSTQQVQAAQQNVTTNNGTKDSNFVGSEYNPIKSRIVGPCTINKTPAKYLCDEGADETIISEKLFGKYSVHSF